MDISIFQATVLGVIQGLTEFLPISSSAHLLLPKIIFGWKDQGLIFDVALHLGSLLAVIAYFKKDIMELSQAVFARMVDKKPSLNAKLGFAIIIATLPAASVGLFVNNYVEHYARSTEIIAIFTIIFAVLLLYADRRGSRVRSLRELTWREASYIGLAQVIALIPGTSRSGITMSAALMLGFKWEAAAKFSFLLSIPIILGSSILKAYDVSTLTQANADLSILVYGILISALIAYSCIHYFLLLIEKIGILPFVVYRVGLGTMLFIFY